MPAKNRLLELTQNDPEVLSFLEWIQAPDSLKSFPIVLEGFKALAPYLMQVSEKSDDLSATEPGLLTKLSKTVAQIEQIIASALSDDAVSAMQPNPKHKDPFHGVTLTAPLYVLVGSLGSPEIPPQAKLAAAVVICTAKELLGSERQKQGKRIDYTAATATGLNAVRLSVNSNLISLLPSQMENLAGYKTRLVSILEGDHPLTTTLRHYLVAIERLIRFLVTVTGGVRRGGRIVRELDIKSNTNPHTHIHVQQVTTMITNTDVNDEWQDGLAVEELADDIEFVSFETTEHFTTDVEPNALESIEATAPPKSVVQQILQRRAMIGQMERAAQLLPFDWSLLTSSECADFLRGLHDEHASLSASISNTSPENHRIRVEATVALSVAFWAGRPFHTIPRLTLYAAKSDMPQHFGKDALAYIVQDGHFIIPALRPKADPRYKKADLTLANACDQYVILPLGRYLAGRISKLPNSQDLLQTTDATLNGNVQTDPAPARARRSTKAFSVDGERLVKRMNAIVDAINDRSNGRLTPHRISQHLFSTIGHLTGDVALASLTAGRAHRLSDTALHYLSVVGNQLSEAAITAASHVERGAIAELEARQAAPTRPRRPIEPARAPGHAGSPIHPRTPVIQDLADALSAAITAAKRNVVSIQYRIDVHNAFAQYLHWMLRFSTGLRHVTVPLPGWDRIDRDRAVAFISDKDDVASYSSRLVPLPTIMLEQLVAWADHCAGLDGHLAGFRMASSTKLTRDEVVFYLNLDHGRIKIKSANSAVARNFLQSAVPNFKLPANCNRHYLRSKLTELRCPAELIDAFMGHWTRGREPLGRYSGLSPHDYMERIRPYQEEMMKGLGFKLVRGWS
jgi:hypothetical protein